LSSVPRTTPRRIGIGWRSGGAAAVAVAAIPLIVWATASGDPLLLVVGMLAITVNAVGWIACVIRDERPASDDPEEDGERVSDVVERGMGELARYLERHAAFATYLDHHRSDHTSVEACVDDSVPVSRHPGGWGGRRRTR